METGERVQDLRGHEGNILCLGASVVDAVLFTASTDGTAKKWALEDGSNMLTVDHGSMITCMALCDEANALFTGGADGLVKKWHTGTGQLLAEMAGHTLII